MDAARALACTLIGKITEIAKRVVPRPFEQEQLLALQEIVSKACISKSRQGEADLHGDVPGSALSCGRSIRPRISCLAGQLVSEMNKRVRDASHAHIGKRLQRSIGTTARSFRVLFESQVPHVVCVCIAYTSRNPVIHSREQDAVSQPVHEIIKVILWKTWHFLLQFLQQVHIQSPKRS